MRTEYQFKGAPLNEKSNIQAGDELIVTKQEATLEVRITKVETWQEEIPYTTETTTSNEYTVGTKENGAERCERPASDHGAACL